MLLKILALGALKTVNDQVSSCAWALCISQYVLKHEDLMTSSCLVPSFSENRRVLKTPDTKFHSLQEGREFVTVIFRELFC